MIDSDVSDAILADVILNLIEYVQDENEYWNESGVLDDDGQEINLRKYHKCTIDDLGRVEVIDKQTGNELATFHLAEKVLEFLVALNIPLHTVRLEWFDEEADTEKYGIEEEWDEDEEADTDFDTDIGLE